MNLMINGWTLGAFAILCYCVQEIIDIIAKNIATVRSMKYLASVTEEERKMIISYITNNKK